MSEPVWRERVFHFARRLHKARRASLCAEEQPASVNWNGVGQHFRFLNRNAQSTKLLQALCVLNEVRLAARMSLNPWEAHKRDVYIPVCTGMPGIGKTRFARDAIFNLALRRAEEMYAPRTRASLTSAEIEAAGAACVTGEHKDMMRACVHACYHHRNLRVDFSSPHVTTDLKTFTAASLLYEWVKEATTGRQEMLELWDVLQRSSISIADAVRAILTFDAHRDEPPRALLINLDEAQKSDAKQLASVLEALSHYLLVEGQHVYVTVTGTSAKHVADGFSQSSLSARAIVLPLLTDEHLQIILSTFLPTVRIKDNVMLQFALWWLGGVPRFLEYFLRSASRLIRSTEVTREQVADFLSTISPEQAMMLVRTACSKPWEPPTQFEPALRAALQLALTDTKVALHCELVPNVTVEGLQGEQLLYWEPDAHVPGKGSIRLPPVTLHWWHAHAVASDDSKRHARIHLLQVPLHYMSSRDNESVLVGVLMHKFAAARTLGNETIALSDLGIPVHAPHVLDVKVTIPTCFHVVRIKQRWQQHNRATAFGSLVATVRAAMKDAERRATTAVAYISEANSSFADSMIVLQDFVILIQEKQSEIAKMFAAGLNTVSTPRRTQLASLEAEYEKVREAVGELPHVFLQITDDATLDVLFSRNACLVPAVHHAALMGSAVARIRSNTLGNTAVASVPGALTCSASGAAAGAAATAGAAAGVHAEVLKREMAAADVAVSVLKNYLLPRTNSPHFTLLYPFSQQRH
ncbi:MAG: hypothetical protein EOO65_01670 [Methanosarcinales archaeon]|nr:MAG: hypothetical protein EOO65_01670 [Methanosarcinales archaeon]